MIDEKINRKYLNKIKLFQKYNKHYYNLNQPLVDDSEFDKLKLEIIDLEKQYKFLLERMPKKVDWNKLSDYENVDMTVGSQELACVAGGCEI